MVLDCEFLTVLQAQLGQWVCPHRQRWSRTDNLVLGGARGSPPSGPWSWTSRVSWTVVIPEMTLREVQLLNDLGQEEKQLELEDIFIKVTGL